MRVIRANAGFFPVDRLICNQVFTPLISDARTATNLRAVFWTKPYLGADCLWITEPIAVCGENRLLARPFFLRKSSIANNWQFTFDHYCWFDGRAALLVQEHAGWELRTLPVSSGPASNKPLRWPVLHHQIPAHKRERSGAEVLKNRGQLEGRYAEADFEEAACSGMAERIGICLNRSRRFWQTASLNALKSTTGGAANICGCS